jgi:hypothetical protein
MKQEQDLKYMLIQISKDCEFIKEKVNKIEEFTMDLNRRLISVEKSHSYIRGGFYVFIATFSIILALSTIIK